MTTPEEETQIIEPEPAVLRDAPDEVPIDPVGFPAGPEDWVQSPNAEIQIEGVPVDEALVAFVAAPEQDDEQPLAT